MKRIDFLKNGMGFLGMTLVAPSFLKAENAATTCTVDSTETIGPFPTKSPSSLIKSNIIGDRTGVAFTINIYIKNVNNSCGSLQGAIVDIWHCDKDGYYSEYGGNNLQTINFTSNSFLRGRQVTDADGLVTFTSIFPGWYPCRATHIHVNVYNAAGTSLIATQIAFPEAVDSAVVLVNSATAYGYTKGMTGYTFNASDGVFFDSFANEMSTVTGSIVNGFVLESTINVSGPTGVTSLDDEDAENQFRIGQNYPNPFTNDTNLPILLKESSDVKIELFNMLGKKIGEESFTSLNSGKNELNINANKFGLTTGNYVCNIEISNNSGTYKQAKLITKK